MVRLEDLKDLDKLNDFRLKYKDVLDGFCWGCPGSLEAAVNKINSLKFIPMVDRLTKYEIIPRKDRYGQETVPHHYFTGKAIKGLPSTVTPNNVTDEIVSLIEKHHPKVFELNYKKKQTKAQKKEELPNKK